MLILEDRGNDSERENAQRRNHGGIAVETCRGCYEILPRWRRRSLVPADLERSARRDQPGKRISVGLRILLRLRLIVPPGHCYRIRKRLAFQQRPLLRTQGRRTPM